MANTPAKNLNVPAHGSFVNDWDVPVNENWAALDTALGGTTGLSVTGQSGVVALTATQYTPFNLEISGTLTAAVNYQVPSGVGGFWTIANNASGAFTVTFSSAAGGPSVVLQQGLRTAVMTDGGNGVALFSTTLSGAGGANTQVQYNSSGSLAGSVNLVFDGTRLTAAGFEGPIGDATPHAGTFSAINGPIGGGTPAAGAFTTLTASGNVTLAGAAEVTVPTKAPGTNTTDAASTAFVQATITRIPLAAGLNLYVATSGSDSSNGLSAGTPFLTIQHAINVALNGYDTQGNNITINVGAGTFSTSPGVLMGAALTGGGAIIINAVGSGSTTITAIGSGAAAVSAENSAILQISNANITSTTGAGLFAGQQGQIIVGTGMAFGACGTGHIAAFGSGSVQITANYAVNGNAQYHWNIDGSSFASVAGGLTLTFNNPTFGVATAQVPNVSLLEFLSPVASFAGAGAIGTRYNSNGNSVINTQGSGATYLPGNAGGATANGGQYI